LPIVHDAFKNTLFNSTVDIEDENHSKLFEYYKMCVAGAESISDRRQTANSFFLTINTVLISFVSYMNFQENHPNIAPLAVSFAGLAVCFMWFRLIQSYKELNSAKFMTILEIEKQLPMQAYAAEWIALGEGKDTSIYHPFTSVESRIPILFMALHFAVILYSLLIYFKPI
jgi:hypothetical protein